MEYTPKGFVKIHFLKISELTDILVSVHKKATVY